MVIRPLHDGLCSRMYVIFICIVLPVTQCWALVTCFLFFIKVFKSCGCTALWWPGTCATWHNSCIESGWKLCFLSYIIFFQSLLYILTHCIGKLWRQLFVIPKFTFVIIYLIWTNVCSDCLKWGLVRPLDVIILVAVGILDSKSSNWQVVSCGTGCWSAAFICSNSSSIV